jgi:hypothetical protein
MKMGRNEGGKGKRKREKGGHPWVRELEALR